MIWMNAFITINKQEVKWKNWISHNILIIHENGRFLSVNDINRIYDFKCDILQYNSLKDAIPKEWRDSVKSMKVQRNAISSEEGLNITINKTPIPITKITNKTIYWHLVGKIQVPQ
jgi:hypothetical protein